MDGALRDAIEDGDEAAVAEALAGWSEAERRAVAPAVVAADRATWDVLRESFGSRERTAGLNARRQGLWVALLGCATPAELRRCQVPVWIGEAAVAVLAERRPPWLRGWLEGEMEAARDWAVASTWFGIRALERAGVVESLDTDAAVAGMAMALAHGDGALAELEADPELIGRVWRLFEVEGGDVGSLARADKYVSAEKSWRHAILALAAGGRLDRARLLDATLAALARGFPWFRSRDGAPIASAAAREWLAARRGSTKTARLARSLLARS